MMLRRLLAEVFRSNRGDAKSPSSVTASVASPAEPAAINTDLQEWSDRYTACESSAKSQLTQEFEHWVIRNPSKPAWVLLGDWRLNAGQLDAAEAAYRQALRVDPRSPSAQEGLGSVMLSRKELDQAYFHLSTANRYRPFHAPTLNQWGLVCLEQGNLVEAAKHFEQAVEADVNNHHAWHNLGLISVMAGYPQNGIRHFERAIAIRPTFGLAYSNLALAYRDAERLGDALQAVENATRYKADSPRVWVIAADIATDAGQFDLARQHAEKALAIDASHAGAHIVMAKLLMQLGQYHQAKVHYLQALESEPGNAEAEGGLGQLELLMGEWQTGWTHYEARRRTSPPSVRHMGLPLWDGSWTPQTHLLIYAEQGLGDIMLFASCLPDLCQEASQAGAKVTLETYPRLAGLLTRSFPTLTVTGRDVRQTDTDWLHKAECTHEIPMGSLPLHYRKRASHFPSHAGYLAVDSDRVQHWSRIVQARFGRDRQLVALTWRGGLLRSAGVQRSMRLMELLTGLQPTEDVGLILLQHGDIQNELESLPDHWRERCWRTPDATDNMDDTAALTCSAHAVVTVCGTQAHLTGALGRPGAVLVPYNPNWRYGLAGPTTPWYPALTLFRQKAPSDWSDPLWEARIWLQKIIGRHQGWSSGQGHA